MSPFSVLIADDNADLGWLLAGILRREGVAVDVCQDPDIAIENSSRNDYDAIVVEPNPAAGFRMLLDYLDAHRSDKLHTVIVATTEKDSYLNSEWTKRGVFRILEKPLTPKVVRETVMACAANHLS
ncbi:MAG TPA: response regulator [Thermoanaerobaculia bacterium]